MSLAIISDLWSIIKPNIQVTDINDAAEQVVNFLVDNDYDPKDIKKSFKGDTEIQKAVTYFIESSSDDFAKYEDEEDDIDMLDYDEDDNYNDDRYE